MDIADNITEYKLDSKDRAYATGRRKNSIARVWLKRGNGEIKVNGKELNKYFSRPVLQMVVNQPLNIIQSENGFENVPLQDDHLGVEVIKITPNKLLSILEA